MADEIFELKGKVSIDTKSLDSAIKKLKTTLETITGSAEASTSEVTDFVKELTRVSTVSGDATENLDDLEDSVKSTGDETKKAGDNAKKSASSFQKFWGQLKRIAVYRAIRSVLKAISSAIKEGTNNLYEFAKLTGSGTFAKAMDSITTNMSYIKNSLGTALAPIITAFAPVIESLANAFADLAERVARFFALLNGQNGYYRAIKNAKEYQKIQRQLLGFDELNILGNNNSDNANDFEWIENFGELSEFELLVKQLSLNIQDIIPENISPVIIGGSIVGMILGSAGIFKATGSLAGLAFSLGAIGVLLAISSIQMLSQATGIDDSKFWAGLKGLAATAGIFTGLFIGALAGASLGAASLLAITLGVILTLAVQKAQITYETGADSELRASAEVLKEKLTSNSVWDRIGAMVELEGYSTTGAMDFYSTSNEYRAKLGTTVKTRADGGPVAKGDLFIAGEAGPELVSGLGGRTQVFNDTQLIGELSVANEGVISAVMQAANAIVSSVSNMPSPTIKIGDRDIYNASKRGSKIVGESLIQGV